MMLTISTINHHDSYKHFLNLCSSLIIEMFVKCDSKLRNLCKNWLRSYNCMSTLINWHQISIWLLIIYYLQRCINWIFCIILKAALISHIYMIIVFLILFPFCVRWKALKRQLLSMRSHSDAKGIEVKRPNDSIYTYPCPDCMCRSNRSEVAKSLPSRWSRRASVLTVFHP